MTSEEWEQALKDIEARVQDLMDEAIDQARREVTQLKIEEFRPRVRLLAEEEV